MLKMVNNKTVAGLSAWLSLISFGLTTLTKLNPEWFGKLTWPQAILLGILSTLAFAFLASFILLIYGHAVGLIKRSRVGASEIEIRNEGHAKSLSLESRVTATQNHIADLLSKLDDCHRAIDELNAKDLGNGEALAEVQKEAAERSGEQTFIQARLENLGNLVCIQSAVMAAAHYISLMENPTTASRWQQDTERVQQRVFAAHLKFCGPDESIGNGMVGNRAAPNEDLVDPEILRAFRQRYSDLGFAYDNLASRESIMRTNFEQSFAPTEQ